MLKALIRKQMLEVRNVYLTSRGNRNGKQISKNPKGMYVLFGLLYLVIMGSMFAASFGIGFELLPKGLGWLYFTILMLLAFLLGVIGSVLSTAQALYRSKDNEFLAAMPIPPSKIIFVRMIAVYFISLIYESVVMIPAVVYYFIAGKPSFLGVVCCLLGIVVLGFLITAVSCGAGWLVSTIAAKLKNQKIVMVILAVLLIGVIYYFQFNSSRIIQNIVVNADNIAEQLKGGGYLLYAPGLGMTGNLPAFLLFTGITAVLFGIAYFAVTRSFYKVALFKESEKHVDFHKSAIRTTNLSDTLFRKELKRFLSSVTYMMNAGLGLLFLIAVAVLALIKMQDIRQVITGIGASFPAIESFLPVVAVCFTGLLTSLVLIAACSISLEGKYLWLYQSLPIDPYRIFRAKLMLHLVLCGVPALICILALGIVIEASIVTFVCMILSVLTLIMMSAAFQLMMDLKKPKISWTNETQALKTNVTVLVDMLIGFVVPVALGFLYLPLSPVMAPQLYLAILIAVFAGVTLLLLNWLKKKGTVIFSSL